VAKLICMLEGKPAPGVYGDVMICDGDTGEDPSRQLGGENTRLVEDPKHATQGTHCFALTFPKGKGYADRWGRLPEMDWRGYRTLKLDVVNPQPQPVTLRLTFRDQFAANLGDSGLTHTEKLRCAPGKNSFAIPLLGMKDDGGRPLDLSCLFAYFFTVESQQDATLYLDNMRLSAE
jgi:hypothetical protein